MFSTALVALDLAPAERPIVDCLPDLHSWGVRRVVLTHVIQVGYMQGAALAHETDYANWLENLAQPLRVAGLDVLVSIRASGVPADEILVAAAEHKADLVVLGSRGHNVISRLFLGSVARAVIRTTTLPLLLEWVEPSAVGTRQKCEAVCTSTLRHILLATDLSTQATSAELAATHLASRAEQVDCVYVMDADDSSASPISETAARAALRALAQRIEAAGSHGNGVLLQGKASSEIARYAASQDVSLIVVGKRGQNPLASLVIGSTAADLCEIAGRPVLMVP
jgi:nucleotide-binding universal stress UspA family protein